MSAELPRASSGELAVMPRGGVLVASVVSGIIPYSNKALRRGTACATTCSVKVLTAPQSGSMAGTTASHNRFGQYIRNRRTPVNPNTTQQGVVRARMAANSATWRTITSAQRAGWTSLGSQISRNDALGSSYTFNGFMAFCSVNNNNVAAGNAVVLDAPELVTPATILTAVATLTSAAFSVAYTVTPLAAGARLFSYVSRQSSAGRNFNANYFLINVTAAAAASPVNLLASYTAKFGVPVTGNRVFMSFATYLAGFLSGPLVMSQVIA